MKNNSPLEKLLSKYFEHFQSMDYDQTFLSDFDQEKSFYKVQQKIGINKNRNIKQFFAAASILLICGISFYLINNRLGKQLVQINTAISEIKEVNLPDGSKVWLNSKSQLSYAKNLGADNTREITLNGEAYFEVKRNEKKPFIITAQNVKTTVLGTIFNVSAYQTDEDVSVSVVSGKVAVQEKEQAVILVKDQQAVFNKINKTLVKSDAIDAVQNTFWKDGKFLFNGVRLEKVIATIERNFEIKIVINDNIKGCKISADFTDLPIENIFKILGEIVNGSSTYKDNKFYLTGKGCI